MSFRIRRGAASRCRSPSCSATPSSSLQQASAILMFDFVMWGACTEPHACLTTRRLTDLIQMWEGMVCHLQALQVVPPNAVPLFTLKPTQFSYAPNASLRGDSASSLQVLLRRRASVQSHFAAEATDHVPVCGCSHDKCVCVCVSV